MLNFEDRIKLFESIPDDAGRGRIAKELLEKKYGKDFEVQEVRPVELFQDEYQVIVYPYDFPELLFIAKVSLDGEKVTDNYALKMACNNYCESMLEKITELSGDIYLRLNSVNRGFAIEEKEITISEFQEKNPKNKYSLLFFYSPNEQKKDDLYSVIGQMLSGDEQISGKIMFYHVTQKQLSDIQLYLEAHDHIYMDFQDILDKVNPVEIPFDSGKISISEAEWEERIG